MIFLSVTDGRIITSGYTGSMPKRACRLAEGKNGIKPDIEETC
jgi:hypothetical protein